METLTGYHKNYQDLMNELISHGWGEYHVRVTSLKDNTVKVEVNCGRGWVFFIKKEIPIDESKLF